MIAGSLHRVSSGAFSGSDIFVQTAEFDKPQRVTS